MSIKKRIVLMQDNIINELGIIIELVRDNKEIENKVELLYNLEIILNDTLDGLDQFIDDIKEGDL